MRFKLFESEKDISRLLQINQPRLVAAGDHEVCIVRTQNELIAFRNECPHMGERLHAGRINPSNEIVCPLHAYKFNLFTGDEENARCGGLRFVQLTFETDGVYLNL